MSSECRVAGYDSNDNYPPAVLKFLQKILVKNKYPAKFRIGNSLPLMVY